MYITNAFVIFREAHQIFVLVFKLNINYDIVI